MVDLPSGNNFMVLASDGVWFFADQASLLFTRHFQKIEMILGISFCDKFKCFVKIGVGVS